MALSLFTCIPVPQRAWDERYAGLVMPFFPLVGLLLGGIWCGMAALLTALGVRAGITIVVLAFSTHLLSGFLHLDGFMDVHDAVLSRKPLEERRQILKDSHTGAFGVLSAVFLLLLQIAAVSDWQAGGGDPLLLLVIPVWSRGLAGLALLSVPLLPHSGYGRYFRGKKRPAQPWIMAVVVVGAAVYAAAALGRVGAAAFAAGCIGFAAALGFAWKGLGGMNGDVSGCCLSVCECAALVGASLACRL